MNKRLVAVSIAALSAASLAGPALAHHSGSMFDPTKTVTLEGTVKEFQYTNPHSWLEIMVVGPDGKATEGGLDPASGRHQGQVVRARREGHRHLPSDEGWADGRLADERDQGRRHRAEP